MNGNMDKKRKGFSLIEILIVIAIIAVLLGLLLPAIQSIRFAAVKTQNQNNIKQILIAWHDYNSIEGRLPLYGSYDTQDGANAARQVAQDNWVSGTSFFLILPYLDRQTVYESSYGPIVQDVNGKWNRGYVSTKLSPTTIKTYVSDHDPSYYDSGKPFTGLSYPQLSFPINGDDNIEHFDTTYTPVISEAYAARKSWVARDFSNGFGTGSTASMIATFNNTYTISYRAYSGIVGGGCPSQYQVSPTYCSAFQVPASAQPCDCSANPNQECCHQLEWYTLKYLPVDRPEQFDDYPPYSANFTRTIMHDLQSQTPGAIDIGMLDGRVQRISSSVDKRTWVAISSGTDPLADLDP